MDSKTSTGVLAASATTAAALLIASRMFGSKKNQKDLAPDFLKADEYKAVVKVLQEKLDYISGDSLVKIVRQLEFWVKEKLPESELVDLTKRLVYAATWQSRMGSFQVPKVRFGRTEIQMPIVTCGSMRFQHTWMPDFMPIAINKKKVVETPSQVNLLEIVRQCLKMGINHFETARMYGTSEVQLMHALTTLIEQGEIKRSDFILQTKLPVGPKSGWEKAFSQSWEHFEPLGYIDLLSFWCVSKDGQVEMSLSDAEDGIMATTLEWKKQGKIKHIGFSTHGSAENIMKMIESNKFDYVNLHYHYFGSYHAEGTPDTQGGHGNLACVKRALELDMGVFNISPIDKGGRLYQPSSQVARTIGPQLTPIAFANLYSWITAGMHTVSVGFARPEDLTETLDAVELFVKGNEVQPVLRGATERLDNLAMEKLGEKWYSQGLLKVPSPLEKVSNGIGLGHALWCSNMLHAFGMYETAKSRYKNLVSEGKKWNKKKSYDENMKAM
jgi:predicted aldo/keto reductase-like oxidoreductase